MSIDESRQYGGPAEIDDLYAWSAWNRLGSLRRHDFFNSVSANDDYPIVQCLV